MMAGLLFGGVSSCTHEDTESESDAKARVVVMALSSADVTSVKVTVTGPGIHTPIVVPLTEVGDQWTGIISRIPAGTDRTFLVQAFEASDAVIYQEEATGITVTRGATVVIAVTAQQIEAPTTSNNAAPIIDAMVVSSVRIAPLETITLSAQAHDSNPADPLSYAWTATGGTFSSTSSPEASWTAPAVEGSYALTIAVSDPAGETAELTLQIAVGETYGKGSAAVEVTINTWPTIVDLSAAPERLHDVGSAVLLDAVATDADGDSLSYVWSSDCAGAFSGATERSPTFTLSTLPAGASCTFTVLVGDGRGGSNSGTLSIPAGPDPALNEAPQIISASQSVGVARPGDSVTLRVEAADPNGTPLTFSWSASSGTTGAPATSGGVSQVTWIAPAPFSARAEIQVAVADATGVTTVQSFEVTPAVIAWRDDFNAPLSATDWVTSFTAGAANVYVEATSGVLVLETVPNTGCATAQARGTRSFSVLDGTLVFESRILDAYVDHAIYGDAQPRGLAAGSDRNNAIEFINAYPVPSHVACRTVHNGVVTETNVDIGQSVRSPADYRIVARPDEVSFFVNGVPVATHTTNIPTGALNVFFSTGDSCAGNVPVTVDWVSYEATP